MKIWNLFCVCVCVCTVYVAAMYMHIHTVYSMYYTVYTVCIFSSGGKSCPKGLNIRHKIYICKYYKQKQNCPCHCLCLLGHCCWFIYTACKW